MDKGWYARFIFMIALAIVGWLVLWPSLDTWIPAPEALSNAITRRISPGLDIQGGLRLMYEVEVDEAIRDRRDLRADQLSRELGVRLGVLPEDETPSREQLAELKKKLEVHLPGERRIRLVFASPEDADKLDRDLVTRYGDIREVTSAEGTVVLEVATDFLDQIRETAVQQARETIKNRIDGLGLKEAAVSAQNTDIIVEVPGADEDSFDRIRELISRTARLEFKIVDDDSTDFVASLGQLPEGIESRAEMVSAGVDKPQVTNRYLLASGPDSRQRLQSYVDSLTEGGQLPEGRDLVLGRWDRTDEDNPVAAQTEEAWRTYLLHARAEVTGQAIEDAFVSNDPQTNRPYVAVNFNDDGADAFRDLTGRNVKRRMAIVLDDRVESAPVIQDEIGGGHCQITLGGMRPYNQILNEANDLVIVLKAGALPVPIRPANEQMIGPSLGQDGIRKGALGGAVGVALVLVFMLLYYQMAGVVADLMVVLNIMLLLAAQAYLEATLTLPGIAAIALNIGMAVDANVLITERIREELRAGKSPRSAVDQGFARAFWSIVDSQFTTFLAGVVLFQFGTGPIKGFAAILMIGICTSLFTGVFCSRVLFEWLTRGLRVARLHVG